MISAFRVRFPQCHRKIGDRYNRMLEEIRADMVRCNYAAFTYFYPKVETRGINTLSSPMSKLIFTKGFAAGKTLNEIMNGLYRMPFQKPVYPASVQKFADTSLVMPWTNLGS